MSSTLASLPNIQPGDIQVPALGGETTAGPQLATRQQLACLPGPSGTQVERSLSSSSRPLAVKTCGEKRGQSHRDHGAVMPGAGSKRSASCKVEPLTEDRPAPSVGAGSSSYSEEERNRSADSLMQDTPPLEITPCLMKNLKEEEMLADEETARIASDEESGGEGRWDSVLDLCQVVMKTEEEESDGASAGSLLHLDTTVGSQSDEPAGSKHRKKPIKITNGPTSTDSMPKIANNVAASEGDPKQLSQNKTEKSLKKGIRSGPASRVKKCLERSNSGEVEVDVPTSQEQRGAKGGGSKHKGDDPTSVDRISNASEHNNGNDEEEEEVDGLGEREDVGCEKEINKEVEEKIADNEKHKDKVGNKEGTDKIVYDQDVISDKGEPDKPVDDDEVGTESQIEETDDRVENEEAAEEMGNTSADGISRRQSHGRGGEAKLANLKMNKLKSSDLGANVDSDESVADPGTSDKSDDVLAAEMEEMEDVVADTEKGLAGDGVLVPEDEETVEDAIDVRKGDKANEVNYAASSKANITVKVSGAGNGEINKMASETGKGESVADEGNGGTDGDVAEAGGDDGVMVDRNGETGSNAPGAGRNEVTVDRNGETDDNAAGAGSIEVTVDRNGETGSNAAGAGSDEVTVDRNGTTDNGVAGAESDNVTVDHNSGADGDVADAGGDDSVRVDRNGETGTNAVGAGSIEVTVDRNGKAGSNAAGAGSNEVTVDRNGETDDNVAGAGRENDVMDDRNRGINNDISCAASDVDVSRNSDTGSNVAGAKSDDGVMVDRCGEPEFDVFEAKIVLACQKNSGAGNGKGSGDIARVEYGEKSNFICNALEENELTGTNLDIVDEEDEELAAVKAAVLRQSSSDSDINHVATLTEGHSTGTSTSSRKKLKTKKQLDRIRKASGPSCGLNSYVSSDEAEANTEGSSEKAINKRKLSASSSGEEDTRRKMHKRTPDDESSKIENYRYHVTTLIRAVRVDAARLPLAVRNQLSKHGMVSFFF